MPKFTISLGLHLDGQRASTPADRLGRVTVGPLGLLTILETQLGLLGERPSQSERIVQYRDSLKKVDSPSRFYHETFATDELGTAATLLGWRDSWYLHGWDGKFAQVAEQRLTDLAAVEECARGVVAPSIGERLRAVLEVMGRRRPAISEVRLHDPLGTFSGRWRDVLGKLPLVDASAATEPSKGGFLGRLQGSLIEAARGCAVSSIAWQADDTVMVVRAETRALASAWLAAQVRTTSSLVVAPSDGADLDIAIVGAGRPGLGLREPSAFRPSLQVLALALEILWEPLNFYGLMQFLTHPICPVPGFVRRQLAAKVADRPGIGGRRWESVMSEIADHYGDNADAVLQKVRPWVEHPRFAQDMGAPVEVVQERVERLADFFRARLGDTDQANRIAYNAGYSQCRACAESLRALKAQGVAAIRPRQLQKLVAQATAHGSENPLLVAEVDAGLAITHPAAAVEPIDQVIWWQLTMPVLPSVYPWSAAEIRSLAQAGVELPSMDEQLAHTTQHWLRPILAARKKLVLVLPPKGEEVHPVWQMIEAVVDRAVIQPLEALLTTATSSSQAIVHKGLPQRKRWWQLPDGIHVPLRQKESFSSLELLLFNPYHWLLRYPAQLRPSRIIALGGDFRMLGNLAHALVEAFYARADALQMSDRAFDTWFTQTFERLVIEEGALLLMPGRRSDLEGFRHRLCQAVTRLRQQMAKAGIAQVTPEMELSGNFAGGDLSGFADLVVQKSDTDFGIVDMKWSGAKKYPEKLKQNRHLQLAIYAELFRQKNGVWPSVAYYILDRARFFAPDTRLFPDADAVASQSGENTAQLWQRFNASWCWRKAQIEAGRFEVALESITPTDESVPPEDAISAECLNEAYNDYVALSGWDV